MRPVHITWIFDLILLGAFLWFFLPKRWYYKLRGKLMTFEEALKKLKEGYIIQRCNGEWKRAYKKGFTEVKGKIQEVYGTLYTDQIFTPGGSFYLEDVMADDWIIKGKKIEVLAQEK